MLRVAIVLLLGCGLAASAQNSSRNPSDPSSNHPSGSQRTPDAKKPVQANTPGPAAQADRVNVNDLGNEPGESSSKDAQIDISPPPDDAAAHPQSADAVLNEEAAGNDISEFHTWDPHKAAKDVEVGDFYFKRKNYTAAESRYREALFYKDNDATATFRLAVCLEKMNRPDEALGKYEAYLKILPYGPEAENAKKAIERLRAPATSEKTAK